MKNLLATIGCFVVLKKARELYCEYHYLKRCKEPHVSDGHRPDCAPI